MAKFVSLTDKVVATRSGRSFEFKRGVALEIPDDKVIREDLIANHVMPAEEVDEAVLEALSAADAERAKAAEAVAAAAAKKASK